MPETRYPIPLDEAGRLAALRQYKIVDTPPEPEFDHIVRLAADLFHVPTALVSLVDDDRQFFKARVGFEACDSSRKVSFCAHTLLKDDVLVIPDAQVDPQFKDNALVTGAPFVRFYAGAPLKTPSGHRIGSLCIIDTMPRRPLTTHEKGLLTGLARITMDHLERKRLETLKRASMQMAAATPDAIICSGPDGRVSFWNAAAERMFGFARSEIMGQPMDIIIPLEHRAAHAAGMARVQAGGPRHLAGKTVEITALRKDCSTFPVELSLALWRDDSGVQAGSIMRDLTERHQSRERLRILTHFDRLTGLPNRVRFLERIDEALGSVGRFSVLKIGFDKFKLVNGSLGMAAGDLVLKIAAERVRAAAGPEDIVARLGADEFGILRIGHNDRSEADSLAANVLSSLAEPYDLGGPRTHLRVSVGTVLCPTLASFDDADAVLKAALLALQEAKKGGGNRAEVFHTGLSQLADNRQRIDEELRQAATLGQFELFYQPQVCLADSKVNGAEALLRWRHPDRGVLAPAAFLPVLETSDISIDVGRWILRTACRFAAEMTRGGKPIRIGVNLFAAQLQDPQLEADVMASLGEAGLPPDLLELEITETTMLGVEADIIAPLRRLRAMGVKLAFDDYGTGYASLSLLKRYPLTRLKIDREFVRNLESDSDDAAIVKAVLAMGKSLGLEVIAEGIETIAQAALLMGFKCIDAQGYLFGKPMPGSQFEDLLLSQRLAERQAA